MKQGDVRIAAPKIFAQKDNPHCPIHVYKEYRARRPSQLNTDDARFYLSPLYTSSTGTWFSHKPIEEAKLEKIMNDLAKTWTQLMVKKVSRMDFPTIIKLTYKNRMDFPTIINSTSPFPF